MQKSVKVCTADAPRLDWHEALSAAVKENGETVARLITGSPVGNTHDALLGDGRMAGVMVTSKKWARGVIRVAFMDGDSRVWQRVKPYFHEWSKYANISFRFVDSYYDAEIRVSFADSGSWSYIGTDALAIPRERATMNYGWLSPTTDESEYRRVVLHEVGHALGMTHEHQNPSGGIPWDREAVYRYYSGPPNHWDKETIDRNIFARYSESQTQFTSFDRNSIMAYAVPNSLTLGDWEIGWNTRLSEVDKRFISEQYPKPAPPKKDCGPAPSLSVYMTRYWRLRTVSLSQTMRDFWAARKEHAACKRGEV